MCPGKRALTANGLCGSLGSAPERTEGTRLPFGPRARGILQAQPS